MEFSVSNQELNRRKMAFAALVISVAIGTVMFSYILNFPIPLPVLLLAGVIFLAIYIITFRHLTSLVKIKIQITDHLIERQKGNNTEKYSLDEVKSLKVKRRTNGIIRELYITFKDHKHLHISACEERFEKLKDILLEKTHHQVHLREVREPLDFDHILFYPILGFTISLFGILFLKLMAQANNTSIEVTLLIFAVYTFFLALYFIIKKPISLESGKDQSVTDLIFGVVMIIASVFMAIIGLWPR